MLSDNMIEGKSTNLNDKGYHIKTTNCLPALKKIPCESIDSVITDPPFFLSSGGITCKSGRMVSVDKGSWDKSPSFEDTFHFNKMWFYEAARVLKPGGTMWVFGTLHNVYQIGYLTQAHGGLKILNNVTWQKTAPPPNLACRSFTHSTETILWIRKEGKSKHFFDYSLSKTWNNGKQMKDVWTIGRVKKVEKEFGKHPTQKPLEIMERLVLSSTQPGDVILDPFSGSGTTGVAAVKHGRKYIGFDIDASFNRIARKRIRKLDKSIDQ